MQVNRYPEDSSKPHARRRRTRHGCRSLVGSNVRWILVVRRHCVLRNPPARFIIVEFAAAVSQIAFAADAARAASRPELMCDVPGTNSRALVVCESFLVYALQIYALQVLARLCAPNPGLLRVLQHARVCGHTRIMP